MDLYDALRSAPQLVSFWGAFVLLCVIVFTTTYNNPILRYVRLLIGLPTAILCLAFAFPREIIPGLPRGIYMEMCLTGLYGLIVLLDHVVIGFWEGLEDRPRWMLWQRSRDPKSKNGSNEEAEGKYLTLPMPATIKDRLLYSVDLVLTIRGASILQDRVWSFAPPTIRSFHPSRSRTKFIVNQLLPSLLVGYFFLDLSDTINKSRVWDTTSEHPLTSLPIPQQIIYTISTCLIILVSMPNTHAMVSVPCLLFLRAPTNSFPPLFNDPLSATSLSDWWSYRWHANYRRPFDRFFLPITWVLPKGTHPRLVKVLRCTYIFGLSALLHLIYNLAMPKDELHPHIHFYNAPTVKFFMLQPPGLFLEFAIVKPLTGRLPPFLKLCTRWLYLCAWLLWTGRYFADGFIVIGFMDQKEFWMAFSPIRGLWKGQWLL